MSLDSLDSMVLIQQASALVEGLVTKLNGQSSHGKRFVDDNIPQGISEVVDRGF